MDRLLYGAAYYDEYMPCERLSQDVEMMKKAGINTVRIAESTWSTCEPQEGVFDFSHVERVMDAMEEAGIGVIIGTPTYAVPTWMVKSYPDVLAETRKGRGIYGPRQIMDIAHPAYLFYAERVIRKLMECTAHRKCVIGFQIDNETKPYGTAGRNVQEKFVKYLRKKFNNDLDALNAEFGLDYWSNRINAWEDFPDVRGTINGSLGAEFEKFQRSLVTDFLRWQAEIVSEYKREDQFITHNLDLCWRGYSYGVQPEVDHYEVAKCLTIAGVDIYHPSQDQLTGEEIAFGGDLMRSLKKDNYLVIETEAQGFPDWTPYDGQLRLQAFSHVASGANSVMYWHWHSLHNAFETYWKGVLSHDLQENAVYREVCTIGNDFKRIGSHLVNLKKQNRVAILVSNEALTALKWFSIQMHGGSEDYNDIVRWMYNTLYHMNIECDFIWPETESADMDAYEAILVPALYAASDAVLERLNRYVEQGGTLIATFKTGFANEKVKVSHDAQPHILNRCLGVTYQEFAFPKQVKLTGESLAALSDKDREASVFMELLMPQGAEVLASYEHPNWGRYAAVTKNTCGKGSAVYIGCKTSEKMLEKIFRETLPETILAEDAEERFPVIVRKGVNDLGRKVYYYLNYSGQEQNARYAGTEGTELLSGRHVTNGEALILPAWGFQVIEAVPPID
ncbi:MAG: beta-galactosidase [Lachnospiraceae bacterium]|nr:beta-galactosidase [Lachnospiraceae bacterium]